MSYYEKMLLEVHTEAKEALKYSPIELQDTALDYAKPLLEGVLKQVTTHLNESDIRKVYFSVLADTSNDCIVIKYKKGYVDNVIKASERFANKYSFQKGNTLMYAYKNAQALLDSIEITVDFDCNPKNKAILVVNSEFNIHTATEIMEKKSKNEIENLESKGLSYFKRPKVENFYNIIKMDKSKIKFNARNVPKSKTPTTPPVKKADNTEILRPKTNERLMALYTHYANNNPKIAKELKYVDNQGYLLNIRGIPSLVTYDGIIRTDFNQKVLEITGNTWYIPTKRFFSVNKSAIKASEESIKFLLESMLLADDHRKRLPIK